MKRQVSESASQRVFDAAVTRLAQRGYGYDARLCDADVVGFAKALGDEVQAIVQFQQRGDEWTIDLRRVKGAEFAPQVYGGYAGAVGARLGHVLWFVANVRDGGQPDRWWTPDEIEAAVDLLIAHGLPWLEDPQAARPWEMPTLRWPEFVEAVMSIAGPVMLAQGYRAATQTLAGNFPYPYFVKALPNGEYALIEFQVCYSLDPERFLFDVRLQRKTDDNPLDFGGVYEEWRAVSLGQLVWRKRWADEAAWSVAAVKSLLWSYADRAELADRLREVLEQVAHIARPWLEGNLERGDGAAVTIQVTGNKEA